jgi:hypothetical protein
MNSEVVLVALDATGRALRPVASVLDAITTLSIDVGLDGRGVLH